jgi:translation elongation factor EF-1beta
MVALEASVRGIVKDGLVWGASKLVPVGFGIKKLQINLIIEDDKVGLDDLQEEIAEFEDYVQSTDIVSLDSKVFSCTDAYKNHRLLCKSCRLVDDLLFTNLFVPYPACATFVI